MITTLDLVNIIWQRLNGSQLKTTITGGVYKKRPAGSQTEDVVINCLPINNLDLQTAIVNVNIHVPNITIQVGTVQDSTQPNFERLQELAAIAIAVLTDVWAGDYNYDVQQQTMIEDEEAGDHYINIRIEFFNINIKN
jgi:hypothetical protein